ncbi:MAG: alpha/beta hydrolase [Actinomycetes bacterium]
MTPAVGATLWVDRDGFRIHCRVLGSGPTVVLHTGGAGDGTMWREYLPYLTGLRAVLLDHRGRGLTDSPTDVAGHSMGEYVSDVVAVARALDAPDISFVGYSMGAQVGYALAALHPELVTALVGLGGTWEVEADSDEDAQFASLLRRDGMAALVTAVEQDEGLTLPAWLRDQFLQTDPEQFALSIEAWADWSPWAVHASISCPTLLVAGSQEDPSRSNATAAAQMADARAVWLPDLGHVGAFLAAEDQCQVLVPHLRSRAQPR